MAVEQHEIERAVRLGGAPNRDQRRRPIVHALRQHAPAARPLLEDAAVGRVVVDDQHREAAHVGRVAFRLLLRAAEPGGELEGAALAFDALDPDASAHHTDELRADGEPEAGAAELAAGRAVGLGEGLEDQVLLVGGDADAGVRDLEVQRDRAVRMRRDAHRDADLAALGELDGVADEVEDDLSEPARVADDGVGDVGRDVADQLEVFLVRAQGQRLHRALEVLAQTERRVLQIELAGFDLREVENVVQERQQRVGRRLRELEILALLAGEIGLERELGRAEHAVHRRPDLVTHVGEELRLEPRRFERRFARLDELAELPRAIGRVGPGLDAETAAVVDGAADHQDDEEREDELARLDRAGGGELALEERALHVAHVLLERAERLLHRREAPVHAGHQRRGLLGRFDREVRERHVGLGGHRVHRGADRVEVAQQDLDLGGRACLLEGGARLGPRVVEHAAGLAEPGRLAARILGVEDVVRGGVHRRGELAQLRVRGETLGPLAIHVERRPMHVDQVVVQGEPHQHGQNVECGEEHIEHRQTPLLYGRGFGPRGGRLCGVVQVGPASRNSANAMPAGMKENASFAVSPSVERRHILL